MTEVEIEATALRLLETLDKFKVTSHKSNEVGYIYEGYLYSYWKQYYKGTENEIQ